MLKITKKKNIISQLIIYFFLIIILFGYYEKFSSRFKYKNFMDSVKQQINKNNLDSNYIVKFEKVFYNYDKGFLEKNFMFIIIISIEVVIVVFSLVGIIINIIAIFFNKKMIFISIFIFCIILRIKIYVLYNSFFNEKKSIDLSDDEINKFGEFKKEIKDNLHSVTIRIFFLRIYSFLLIICSFGNIFLSIILFCNIKKEEENVNNANNENNQFKVELGLIKNENIHENETIDDETVDNLIKNNGCK